MLVKVFSFQPVAERGFVTFSYVNKTLSWDALVFISSGEEEEEEEEEGTSVAQSRSCKISCTRLDWDRRVMILCFFCTVFVFTCVNLHVHLHCRSCVCPWLWYRCFGGCPSQLLDSSGHVRNVRKMLSEPM